MFDYVFFAFVLLYVKTIIESNRIAPLNFESNTLAVHFKIESNKEAT